MFYLYPCMFRIVRWVGRLSLLLKGTRHEGGSLLRGGSTQNNTALPGPRPISVEASGGGGGRRECGWLRQDGSVLHYQAPPSQLALEGQAAPEATVGGQESTGGSGRLPHGICWRAPWRATGQGLASFSVPLYQSRERLTLSSTAKKSKCHAFKPDTRFISSLKNEQELCFF